MSDQLTISICTPSPWVTSENLRNRLNYKYLTTKNTKFAKLNQRYTY